MELIDVPDGTRAWVYCAIKRAILPERYAESMKRFEERMERFWNSPQGKRWRETSGDNNDPRKN